MTKTTNEQWEYLFEIIQKSETKYTKARQQVLAFGARIGLEERQKLFQIRDQQATITWPLAMQILNTLPTTDPYRLMGLKRPPMTGTLAGAWTHHILSSYRNGFWEDANIWLGGHEEYLFSKDNTVEIATQYKHPNLFIRPQDKIFTDRRKALLCRQTNRQTLGNYLGKWGISIQAAT